MSDDVPGCFPTWRALRPKNLKGTPLTSSRRPQAPVRAKAGTCTSPEDTEHPHVHYGVPCDYSYGSADDLWLPEELPSYHPTGSRSNEIFRPEVMQTIESTIDELDPELRALSLQIHDHPELMFEERYAHDTLTAFVAARGFTVTPHYLGLATAWRAEFARGTGGRVLGVNSEMDALPGIGHACGHNLIAVAGVGVALAMKAAMERHDIVGKVVLLGTPAEEDGGGKSILIERGGYKDMDVCLMCHPCTGPAHSVGLGPSLAMQHLEVEYFGHSAHAAAAPWEARNALDAAFLAYSSIAVMRQQMRPDQRVHGIIEGRNWAPNVIPDYAKMRWIVRAPTHAELMELRGRVQACLDAAALATSCSHKIVHGVTFYDLRQNSVLSSDFADVIKNRLGMSTNVAQGAIGGSTDFGNVTYELPALHPAYAIPTEPNGGNHTAAFAVAARTRAAHGATMAVAKGLALTGVRVLDDGAFFERVRAAFVPHPRVAGALA